MDHFRIVHTFNFFLLQSHDFFLSLPLSQCKGFVPAYLTWLGSSPISRGAANSVALAAPSTPSWECVWWSATVIKAQGRGGTHHRARPLAERTQGNTTVLLERSPPPIRLSQRQEHIHGAAGVGVQLTQGGRGLRQEVVELPDKHARQMRMHVRHVFTAPSTQAAFPWATSKLNPRQKTPPPPSVEILNSFWPSLICLGNQPWAFNCYEHNDIEKSLPKIRYTLPAEKKKKKKKNPDPFPHKLMI